MKYLLITPAGFEKIIAAEIPASETIGIHSRIFVDYLPKKLPPAVNQVYEIISRDFEIDKLKLPKVKDCWLLIKEVPRQDLDHEKIRTSVHAANPESENVFRLDVLHGKTILSKLIINCQGRTYQVAKFPFSLRPEFAYCMVRLINPEKYSSDKDNLDKHNKPVHTKYQTVYDPLCGSGSIPIEAALYFGRGFSILGSDIDEEHIKAAETNAKKAGVRQHIHFFVHDIREPLKGKIKEKIDFVISELPFQFTAETLKSIYTGLISLNPKSFILLVKERNVLADMMKTAGYKIRSERKVIKGGHDLRLAIFEK